MRALQRNLSHGHDLDSFRVLKEDIAAANERSPLNFPYSAEPEDLWLETATRLRRDFVIEIQHSEIVRRLVFENTRLGRSVVLHRTMAIEVIGRDIQNDGDLRTEGLDRFQLKTRNLKHNPSLGRRLVGEADRRGPNI